MARNDSYPIEIPFPIKGIDQSMPRSAQVGLTCTEAVNTCAFPPFSDREGGGKTEGTRRAWNNQFTSLGTNHRVIGLSSLINALGSASTSADMDAVVERLYPNETISIDTQWVPTGAATAHACTDETPANLETDYVLGTPSLNSAVPNTIYFTVGFTSPTVVPDSNSSVVVSMTYTIDEGAADSTSSGDYGDVACSIILDMDLVVGSTTVVDLTGAVLVSEPAPGWETLTWTLTAAQVAAITAATSDWSALRAKVSATTAGRLTCTNATFKVTQIEINITGSGGTIPPPEPDNFTGQILVHNIGRCRVAQLPADIGSTTLATEEISDPEDTGIDRMGVSTVPFQNKWYAVDGGVSIIITPTGITSGTGSAPDVTDWATEVQNSGQGALPENCRLNCLYRGRMVLARQEGPLPNHSIWYMSRVLDPLDWAYALDDEERPAETSAVAGTNEYLGQPADAITALIPYGDDYLIFGCAKSLWIMEGDPGQGGSIQNLSRQTGVLDSRAWCYDEHGVLYFLGSSGLYRFSKQRGLENVSGRRLFRFLDRIDASQVFIQLVYNAFRKEVMIYLTPTYAPQGSQSATLSFSGVLNLANPTYPTFQSGYGTHLRYDITRDAFFFRTFPWGSMGPWSVLEIYGSQPDDRTFLIGGNDGYIRRPFEGGYIAGTQRYGTADDMNRSGSPTPSSNGACYAITSSFRSAPIEAKNGALEIMATEIHATGTDNNYPLALPLGPVTWKLISGHSPAKVTETQGSEAVEEGTFFDSGYDFQQPVMLRSSAGCHQLIITQNNNRTQSWALDRIVMWFRPAGRRRGV